jgi:CubicO group peptidase (beta-lactamase class C family)
VRSFYLTKRQVSAAIIALVSILLPLSANGEESKQSSAERVREAIAQVETLAQKAIDDNTVVGLAISVVHDDKVVYAKGFGLREVGTDKKVDADTVFQLASVSKPIGATVVAELVGEGKITWDSRISDLDGDFQMFDPWVTREITIRDFYSHRSGLHEHAGDLLEDIGYNREQVLHRMRYQKPETSFRSHYAYTNFGMTEAAVAAAKAYGLTWEAASEEKLYKPLQMNSTSSRFSDFIARPNKALGHVKVDGKWVQKFKRQPDAQSPAGGVTSSVNDLAQWMRLQLANGKFGDKQIVSEEALAETHKPQMLTQFSPLSGLPGFYGLGMNVGYDEKGRLRLGHSGAFAMGAATNVALIPSEKIGIVILTNTYPIGFAEGLGSTFTDIALDGKTSRDWIALFKKVFSDPETLGLSDLIDYSKPPAKPVAALSNGAYVGTFSNDLFGDVTVSVQESAPGRGQWRGLALSLGPDKITVPMNHYDRDVFTFETFGENASGLSGITFLVGANGKASSLTIEDFNKHGDGTFVRSD